VEVGGHRALNAAGPMHPAVTLVRQWRLGNASRTDPTQAEPTSSPWKDCVLTATVERHSRQLPSRRRYGLGLPAWGLPANGANPARWGPMLARHEALAGHHAVALRTTREGRRFSTLQTLPPRSAFVVQPPFYIKCELTPFKRLFDGQDAAAHQTVKATQS